MSSWLRKQAVHASKLPRGLHLLGNANGIDARTCPREPVRPMTFITMASFG